MGASNRYGQRGTTWLPHPRWATTPKLAVRRTVRTCTCTDCSLGRPTQLASLGHSLGHSTTVNFTAQQMFHPPLPPLSPSLLAAPSSPLTRRPSPNGLPLTTSSTHCLPPPHASLTTTRTPVIRKRGGRAGCGDGGGGGGGISPRDAVGTGDGGVCWTCAEAREGGRGCRV